MKNAKFTVSIVQIVAASFFLCLLAAVLFPIFAQAKMGGGPSCFSRVKGIGIGLRMYTDDSDDTFPKAEAWMDLILIYQRSPREFHDPQGVPKEAYGYAYRDSASGLKTSGIKKPESYAVVFDSTLLRWNSHSELSTLPHPGRHNGRDTVGYADGHAKAIVMP